MKKKLCSICGVPLYGDQNKFDIINYDNDSGVDEYEICRDCSTQAIRGLEAYNLKRQALEEAARSPQTQIQYKDIMDMVMSEVRQSRKEIPEWPDGAVYAVNMIIVEIGLLAQRANQWVLHGEINKKRNMQYVATRIAAMAIRFIKHLDEYQKRSDERESDDTKIL